MQVDIPHFFAPTCHGLKQDNQQKYSKICQSCHRFPEAGQARGFSCCSSCNLVRADFAVPWCGLGIHPTRWLKAGLLEAGCSRTWQTFFVEDRQDGNIDLVKAEDLNVDKDRWVEKLKASLGKTKLESTKTKGRQQNRNPREWKRNKPVG